MSNPTLAKSARHAFIRPRLLLALVIFAQPASAQLSSYAIGATDIVGSTGAAAVALGVPDYRFVNDAGLGFGGSNTDVFDVGETAEFTFPVPLRNDPAGADLLVSAFIGGLGATDNATVRVEASSGGTNFSVIHTFDTQAGRSIPFPDSWENNFERVLHFSVEFGGIDNVTHIRLTNLAGTSEGLRLDSIEGLHPIVNSTHAFEVRWERVRDPIASRFNVRIKNIADPNGVPIREWIMDRPETYVNLQDTHRTIVSTDGDFICVENCIIDNHPVQIPYSRHVWSIDGSTEAPAGMGLEPGQRASLPRYESFDTDGDGLIYLNGFRFTVIFADGLSHTIDHEADVMKEIGALYQKSEYFSSTPVFSGSRPVDYYEFLEASPAAVPALSAGSLLLMTLMAGGLGGLLIRRKASHLQAPHTHEHSRSVEAAAVVPSRYPDTNRRH